MTPTQRIAATNEYIDEARRQARDAIEVQKLNLIQAVLNDLPRDDR